MFEKDALLAALDSLWGDFLGRLDGLNSATGIRCSAALPPVRRLLAAPAAGWRGCPCSRAVQAKVRSPACRAFAGRSPLEEFALETRAAYAQLLASFRAQALHVLFLGATTPPTRSGRVPGDDDGNE